MTEPERVGRYEIVAPLRAGGMARVDLARLRGPYGFTRYVVVKRPLPHQATDPAALEQFRVEARLLASLHHPNVVGFVDAGVDAGGVDFMAIEYIHGTSVRDLAPPRGPRLTRRPALAAALTIAHEIAVGLDHAHDQASPDGVPLGVVHRDVSPSNILLGYDGSVKLIDFGVAKLTEGATASGSLRGKVTYMAPEQCKGELIDRRADVYAVGVVLYELVTGHRPFYAPDEVASLHRVIVGEIADPRTQAPELDAALAEIILRATAYDRGDRQPDARTLARELEHYATSLGHDLRGAAICDELASTGAPRPEPWLGLAPAAAVAVAVAPPARRRSRAGRVAVLAGSALAIAGVATYVGLVRAPSSTVPAPAVAPAAIHEVTPRPVGDPVPQQRSAAPAPIEDPPIADEPRVPVEATAGPAAIKPAPKRSRPSRPRPAVVAAPVTVESPAAAEPAAPVTPAPLVSPAPEPKPAAIRQTPKVWDPKAFYPGRKSGSGSGR